MTTADVYILAGSEPLQAYPSQVHASVSGSASGTTISSGSVTGTAGVVAPTPGGGSVIGRWEDPFAWKKRRRPSTHAAPPNLIPIHSRLKRATGAAEGFTSSHGRASGYAGLKCSVIGRLGTTSGAALGVCGYIGTIEGRLGSSDGTSHGRPAGTGSTAGDSVTTGHVDVRFRINDDDLVLLVLA